MVCESCNNSKKSSKDFTRAVIEINNPDKLVLLRKVVIPASMGTKDDFPPTIGKYYNTLLQYEASGDLYLYSSDGIPTQLSSDVSELQRQLEQLGLKVDKEILDRIAADAALNNSINTVSGSLSDEVTARQNADNALQGNITALDNSLATVAKSGSYNDLSNKPTIGNATLTIKKNGSNVGTFTANATANKNIDISVPTKTSDLTNDGSDGASQYVESDDLATVATSGSYNDLSNKPTIGNATLTIKRNDTNAGTFTANATTNKSINIAVPTKTSDLTNDGADGTSTYVESDDLPTVDTTYSSSSNNAIANSTVTNSLDRNVMTNLTLDSTPSTTTVNLNNTKTNLAHPSSTTTSSISLPVASSTQAGVMNSSTFDAIASNTSNINAILSGAVAITGLPASPTQAELTTAWENETGLTSLMNRAGIYDVTNSKVWTYYTNDNTWYAASNTSQVTVSTFTNSSEGLIKGSTNDGQVFAENDGTGSVNGWDTLTSAVSNNTSKLATIAQGAEVNVQANWTQTNTSADDYIKNKPANLVQDANYVHTDNNFTTTLKNKLDGIESGAEANVQADWTQTNTSADDYIKNKPTIPTVNNATLTIQKNGTNVQTFTANSSTNKTANITVPTAVSELTNDANYATTTQLNDGLATKQNTLTAGSNITIANDTISATDTTYTEGNAIDITNNVISADVYPADFFTAGENVSGEGTNVTLNNTINAPIKGVEFYGDTFQQTYSGKNLFPLNTGSYTNHGFTSVYNADGSITVSGTAEITYANLTSNRIVNYEQNKTYTFSIAKALPCGIGAILSGSGTTREDINISAGNTSGKRTLNQTHTVVALYIFGLTVGQSYSFTIYPMIEEGSTASPFEPYVVEAPNPDYPQNVQTVTGEQNVWVHRKNLIDPTNLSFVYSNSPTQIELSSINNGIRMVNNGGASQGRFAVFRSIDLTPYIGKVVRMKATFGTSGGIRLQRIASDGSNRVQMATTTVSNTEISFTVPADLGASPYLGYVLDVTAGGGTTVDFTNLIMTVDSSIEPYEPYQSQSYTIDLGSTELCKIGDYQDYIYKSGDDWYVHKETAKMVLDGTTNAMTGTYGNGMTEDYNFCTKLVNDMKSGAQVGYCSYLTVSTGSPYGADKETIFFGSQSNNYIYMGLLSSRTGGLRTLEAFNTYLETHPATLYYALATPTDTKITDATLIGQLEALWNANTYLDTTHFFVTATGANLPVILDIVAYRKSIDGVLESIPDAQVQSNWTQADSTAVDYIKNKPSLATVATTGSYNDLTNKPTIPAAQVNSDWNANSGVAQILNKPTLATVATSGSYNDLSNKPTIPAAQVNSDWNANSGVAQILNKPTIPTVNNATLTIKKNGSTVATFTANSSTNQTADISVPVITMTTTDPGEGSPLAANNFIGVYE